MLKQTHALAALAIGVALIGFVAIAAEEAPKKKMWAKSFIGEKAPKLEVEEWLGETPEMEGKLVLIDFWATWCGPCRKAIPKLNDWHEKYGDQLVVIGISDERAETVRKFNKPEIHYYNAIDTQARTKKAVEVKGIPHVMILDPDGVVVWEGFPFLNGHALTEDVLKDLIQKHGKPAAE